MSKCKTLCFYYMLSALLLVLLGCKSKELPKSPSQKPLALVSILPQKFILDSLAGSDLEISSLIPPGVAAETYEPKIEQLMLASNAKIFFPLGHPAFPFEKLWLNKLVSDSKAIKVLDCSPKLTLKKDDPHFWLSPKIMQQFSDCIYEDLREYMPDKDQILLSRLVELGQKIKSLDKMIKATLGPYHGSTFLVYHPAWGYFAEDYGLTQIAFHEEGKEPSPGDFARLLDLAREKHIKVIFSDPLAPPKDMEIIARELGARLVVLDPFAYNWMESLEKLTNNLKVSFSETSL